MQAESLSCAEKSRNFLTTPSDMWSRSTAESHQESYWSFRPTYCNTRLGIFLTLKKNNRKRNSAHISPLGGWCFDNTIIGPTLNLCWLHTFPVLSTASTIQILQFIAVVAKSFATYKPPSWMPTIASSQNYIWCAHPGRTIISQAESSKCNKYLCLLQLNYRRIGN